MARREELLNCRREFLKKALYVTPVIVTASVHPAFASNTYGGGENPPAGQTISCTSGGGSGTSGEPSILGRGERRLRWRGKISP
jgi:hypothetical protein